MKLYKASWISNGGRALFSVDIHPDGSRCATGGQGEDSSGKIMIWSLLPIVNDKAYSSNKISKALCEMNNHLGCVNCVRWSNSGRYLASCGDDKLVVIWHISKYGSGSTFGSSTPRENVEQWKVAATLRGHSQDVLHIAWSPQDRYLATCGVDNTVIIWNPRKFHKGVGEQIKVLKKHKSFVKGVCWDPVGKYFASQSDDKTLRVYSTESWDQVKCISEPFKQCGGTTHVLRCDWSPLGDILVSAHAMNNNGSTAQVVSRSSWSTSFDYVGHRKAVTCVRFHPMAFKKDNNEKILYSCVAIGSKDRSLTVWTTVRERPLIALTNVFKDAVMDISWNPSGQGFIACSLDGRCIYCKFSSSEIGSLSTKEELSEWYKIQYKISSSFRGGLCNGLGTDGSDDEAVSERKSGKIFPTSAEELDISGISRGSLDAGENKENVQHIDTDYSVNKGPSRQMEVTLSDGRRRITPCYIPPATSQDGGLPAPFGSEFSSGTSNTPSSPQCITSSTQPSSSSIAQDIMAARLKKPVATSPTKSSSTTTLENNNTSTTGQPSLKEASTSNQSKISSIKNDSKSRLKQSGKHKEIDSGSSGSEASSSSDESDEEDDDSEDSSPDTRRKVEVKKSTAARVDEVVKKKRRVILASSDEDEGDTVSEVGKTSVTNLVVPSTHVNVVEPPAVVSHRGKLEASYRSDSISLRLICSNESVNKATMKNVAKLTLYKDGENVVWKKLFNQPVTHAAINRNVCCVICSSSKIHIIDSKTGRLTLPVLACHLPISLITLVDHHIAALSTSNTVHCWDARSGECLVEETRLPWVSIPAHVCQLLLATPLPVIVIRMSNRENWAYHYVLKTWSLLCHSQQTPNFKGTISPPITLRTLRNARSTLLKSPPTIGDDAHLVVLSLEELELQLQACVLLQSTCEYMEILKAYTNKLLRECEEEVLAGLYNDLIGKPLNSDALVQDMEWDDNKEEVTDQTQYIMGFHKHHILSQLLALHKRSGKFHSLHEQYQSALSLTSKSCV